MPRLSTFYSTSIWPYVRVRPLVYAWLVATATATTVSDTLSLHDALPISARLAIHRNDAPYLRAVRPRERMTLWGLAERLPARLATYVVSCADCEVRSLDDGDSMAGLTVIHAPGHTPGSICLWAENESALFAGDVLNN